LSKTNHTLLFLLQLPGTHIISLLITGGHCITHVDKAGQAQTNLGVTNWKLITHRFAFVNMNDEVELARYVCIEVVAAYDRKGCNVRSGLKQKLETNAALCGKRDETGN
jgi:hypothetical protein